MNQTCHAAGAWEVASKDVVIVLVQEVNIVIFVEAKGKSIAKLVRVQGSLYVKNVREKGKLKKSAMIVTVKERSTNNFFLPLNYEFISGHNYNHTYNLQQDKKASSIIFFDQMK